MFIKCTRNGSDSYSRYDGMTFITVELLLTELGCTDILETTEEEYTLNTRS